MKLDETVRENKRGNKYNSNIQATLKKNTQLCALRITAGDKYYKIRVNIEYGGMDFEHFNTLSNKIY